MRFRRVWFAGFLFLAFFAAFPARADQASPRWIWKTGTLAPKGVGYANQVRDVILPAVRDATNGEVALKVYWGGVMGDDRGHLKHMRSGRLDAAGLSGQGTFMLSPELPVLGLPFLFRNYEEVDYVKSRMIEVFDAIVVEKGFKLLVWLDQDFDQIYSAKAPVTRVADFPRARFATWYGPLEGKFLEMLGAGTVPMYVSELPTAVRTGECDAIIAPSIWIVGTGLYSTLRYVNPARIRYVPAFCVCTLEAFRVLPDAYRENIRKGREQWALDFNRESRVESEKCLEAMVAYGVRKVLSSPPDLEKLKQASLPIWDRLAGSLYSRSLLDQIRTHLREFREKGAAPVKAAP